MKNVSHLARLTSLTLLIALAASAIVAGCNGCNSSRSVKAQPSTLQEIKKSNRIVAGWAPYAPYASINPSSKQPEGFYIDLFNSMAEEAGFEVIWVETTWSTMVADLHAGKFQVMAAPVFRTIPRAKEIAFTRTIDYFGLSAIVQVQEDRFQEPLDFNREGVTVAVTQGEVGHEFATRRLPMAKMSVHKSGDIAIALVDVIEGRADAGICDSWTAKQFAAEHSEKVKDLFHDRPFNPVGAGWFVRSQEYELLQFLNTSIDWLESSGTVDAIADKYELPSFRK